MRAHRTVLGIPMDRQRHRRWLVAGAYLVLGILFALVVRLDSRVACLLFTVAVLVYVRAVGRLFPFHVPGDNDERERAARNRAHFLAYGPLLLVLVAPMWMPELVHGGRLTAERALVVLQEMAWAGYTLALTLPAAILLWSEPDIEPEGAE